MRLVELVGRGVREVRVGWESLALCGRVGIDTTWARIAFQVKKDSSHLKVEDGLNQSLKIICQVRISLLSPWPTVASLDKWHVNRSERACRKQAEIGRRWLQAEQALLLRELLFACNSSNCTAISNPVMFSRSSQRATQVYTPSDNVKGTFS